MRIRQNGPRVPIPHGCLPAPMLLAGTRLGANLEVPELRDLDRYLHYYNRGQAHTGLRSASGSAEQAYDCDHLALELGGGAVDRFVAVVFRLQPHPVGLAK